MDDSDSAKIAQFASEMGVNYPVLLGTDKVSEEYGNVEFLPTSFYIDREGKFVGKGVGLLARSEIEGNIQKALASHVVGLSEAAESPADKAAGQQVTAQ